MDPILLWPNDPSRTSAALGRPHLLPFLHPGQEPRPAILVIPGGGYANVCHGYEGSDVAQKFVSLGYHAFVLEYRCGEHGGWPAPQQDAARAVKLLRARAGELRLDPRHVASLGFSAGGHLAGCLGTSIIQRVDASAGDDADALSPRVDAMILCYAVIRFEDASGHSASGKNLLGPGNAHLYPEYDLSLHLDEETPPTFLFHTAADQIVPCLGSLDMAAKLKQRQIPVGLHLFPFGVHGAGLATDTIDTVQWPDMAHRFLQRVWAAPEEKA